MGCTVSQAGMKWISSWGRQARRGDQLLKMEDISAADTVSRVTRITLTLTHNRLQVIKTLFQKKESVCSFPREERFLCNFFFFLLCLPLQLSSPSFPLSYFLMISSSSSFLLPLCFQSLLYSPTQFITPLSLSLSTCHSIALGEHEVCVPLGFSFCPCAHNLPTPSASCGFQEAPNLL